MMGPRSAPDEAPEIRLVEADGDAVELAVTTTQGEVRVLTNRNKLGDTLVLERTHIDGPGARLLGARRLRELTRALGSPKASGGSWSMEASGPLGPTLAIDRAP